VQVAYEPTDPSFVWVKTAEGRLICKAPLDGHKKGFMPMSEVEQARDRRAAGRLKRLDVKKAEIQAERNGPAIEMEIAQLAEDVELVRPAQIIDLSPRRDAYQLELERKEQRFARFKTIDKAIRTGAETAPDDRRWHANYERDPECTSRLQTERMIAEGRLSG
jgi:putative transposase